MSQRANAQATLADALGRAGFVDQARTAAQQAVDSAASIPDASEQAQALAAVAAALNAARTADLAVYAARRSLAGMKDVQDPAAWPSGLAEIARVLSDSGDEEAARTVTSEILQAAQRIEDLPRRVEHLVQSARTLVQGKNPSHGLAIAREARAISERITDPDSRASSFGGVTTPFFWTGEYADMLGAFQKAFEAAAQIPKWLDRRGTQMQLLGRLSGVPVEHALAVAERLQNPEARDCAFSDIAGHLAADGAAYQALEIASKIVDDSDRAEALAAIAARTAERGDYEQALDIAGQALTAAQDADEDRGEALSAAAAELARAGDIAAASALVDSALAAIEHAPGIDFFSGKIGNDIAGAAALCGRTAEAYSVVKRLESPAMKVRVFAVVARALGELGRSKEALTSVGLGYAAIQELQEGPGRDEGLGALARELLQLAQPRKALRITRQLKDFRLSCDAQVHIARALAEAGDFSSALGVVRRIQNPSWQCWAMLRIADAMTNAGSFEEASKTLGRALDASRHISSPDNRAFWQAEVTEQLIKIGDIKLALTAGRLITAPFSRAVTLAKIADAMTDATPEEAARRISDSLIVHRFEQLGEPDADPRYPYEEFPQDPDARFRLVNALANRRFNAIAAVRDSTDGSAGGATNRIISDAQAAAADIEDSSEIGEALLAIAVSLARSGSWGEAETIGRSFPKPEGAALCLLAVSGSMARAELADRATELGLEALRICAETGDANPYGPILSVGAAAELLVRQLADNGSLDQAIDIVMHMDGPWQVVALHVFWGLIESGNYHRVLQVAADIQSDPKRNARWRNGSSVVEALIGAVADDLACKGRFEDAKNVIAKYGEDAESRSRMFGSIFSELMVAGNFDAALNAAKMAIASSNEVTDPSDQIDALKGISKLIADLEAYPDGIADQISQIQLKIKCLLVMKLDHPDALRLLPIGVVRQLVADRILA